VIALLIVTAVVALASVAALATVAIRSQTAPGPALAGRTVEIHTKRPDDQTIRGILVAQHSDRWTLEQAIYRHSSGDQPIADNVVHVPTANISWYGEPKAGDGE
jgi:hypothetical protein